jgi:hypothetical protein
MARGGFRPGAGRPKGSAKSADTEHSIKREARKAGMTPLEYMLEVMNDEAVDPSRRDRMAIAAAPFVHARAEAAPDGKKAQQQANAEKIATGRFAPRQGPRLAVDNG